MRDRREAIFRFDIQVVHALQGFSITCIWCPYSRLLYYYNMWGHRLQRHTSFCYVLWPSLAWPQNDIMGELLRSWHLHFFRTSVRHGTTGSVKNNISGCTVHIIHFEIMQLQLLLRNMLWTTYSQCHAAPASGALLLHCAADSSWVCCSMCCWLARVLWAGQFLFVHPLSSMMIRWYVWYEQWFEGNEGIGQAGFCSVVHIVGPFISKQKICWIEIEIAGNWNGCATSLKSYECHENL